MPDTKDDIQQRFTYNLGRVAALIALYGKLSAGRGRPAVAETDLLRAAVVLLHASLEDVLRSIAELLLPTRPAEVFAKWELALPSSPDKKTAKLSLMDLLEFRGRDIDEVLSFAIQQHLERSNYNSFHEVARAVVELGLDPAGIREHQPDLDSMMKRRHRIAHRADRNATIGRGQYSAAHLAHKTVETWLQAVRSTGDKILEQAR
ncbi:MAG: HEPN domain-containing protein [Myxococcota bacterium]